MCWTNESREMQHTVSVPEKKNWSAKGCGPIGKLPDKEG